jgi:hypothetical protein
MKVLNLQCSHGHGFEGWFGSQDDFDQQLLRRLIECPICGTQDVARMPSAPRLNLSGAREPSAPVPAQTLPVPAGASAPAPVEAVGDGLVAGAAAQWMKAVQQVLRNTEDVGERFPEEARRIHYGESAQRGIRGQATPEQRAALEDEGIEVMPLPMPAALKGPVQ